MGSGGRWCIGGLGDVASWRRSELPLLYVVGLLLVVLRLLRLLPAGAGTVRTVKVGPLFPGAVGV